MSLAPLAATLHRAHLQRHAQGVAENLSDLIKADARESHEILKTLGITKLGWRQEVISAVEFLVHSSTRRPPPALDEPDSHATLISSPPALAGVLSDDSTTSACTVALALAEHGFVVCQGGLPSIAEAAAREAADLYAAGRMQPGATSPGAVYAMPQGYASPVPVSFWHPREEPGSAAGGMALLDAKLLAFGRNLAAALGRISAADGFGDLLPFGRADDGGRLEISQEAQLMVSCFSGSGTRYAPHVDNADGDGRKATDLGRCFALIYYLNEDWQPADGGEFRAYLPQPLSRRLGLPPGTVPAMDVAPSADTLLVFRADKLLHEVRPTRGRQRLAVTLWLSARSTGRDANAEAHSMTGSAAAGPQATAARSLPLYPRDEYGRCVDAALHESPFRPM
jgi:hypothetical protein